MTGMYQYVPGRTRIIGFHLNEILSADSVLNKTRVNKVIIRTPKFGLQTHVSTSSSTSGFVNKGSCPKSFKQGVGGDEKSKAFQ